MPILSLNQKVKGPIPSQPTNKINMLSDIKGLLFYFGVQTGGPLGPGVRLSDKIEALI